MADEQIGPMFDPLRSLALCTIRPEPLGGTAGWRKTRLHRARWLVPPGNLLLRLLGAGCQVCGRDWVHYETNTFRRAHPEFPPPQVLSASEIWLPHLPGQPVAGLSPKLQSLARTAAFRELGRIHRLGVGHGDAHRRNLLYDSATGRCRIIDFETRFATLDVRAQALDAAIMALDFFRADIPRHDGDAEVDLDFIAALENPAIETRVRQLLRYPGHGLYWYWRLLGYRSPNAERSLLAGSRSA